MTRWDKVFGGLLLGLVILGVFFCAGWWLAFLFDFNLMAWAVGGAVLGLAADVLVLWWLVPRLFSMKWLSLMVVHLLYSVFLYGFFMGVPVFIVCMGLVAGWYVGRRSHIHGIEKPVFRKLLARTQLWCAFVLFVACLASAYIALSDPYTAQNLTGMLSLSFTLTKGMIWGIVLVGGAAQLFLQWLFVRLTARFFYR